MFRKKRYIVLLLIILIFLFHDKLSFQNVQKHGNALIDRVEQTWRGLKTPELAGVEGQAVLIMDRDTRELLYSDHGKKKMYPASTTKILTALILLKKSAPDDEVTVGDEVLLRTPDESSAGLVPGEKLTVRDLTAAMMLPSGNDAARTAAAYITELETGERQSPEQAIAYFAKLMNEKAKELGAVNSHFVNPHGLHDPDHYSTAYDMALIAREAMNLEVFNELVGETEYAADLEGQGDHLFQNRNKLLNSNGEWYFQGANGVKTGYTEKAGYCLVGSAVREERELITVVLHSTEQGVWSDTVKLLDYGFRI
ncbi:D-alanyl-D-alanine carboxypeptidase family protein [Fontibacillus phaseoli]|uniref:D-alanyl-D-alanine carboxypeptidase family protein n=1 Tax=Fontibacillus phaseoli TaxID=1416533 RepID=UPI0011C02804|nr:D-alanyl-D-alanine carboxypeptidase family protein [Fontibacillus phaseoli]